MGAEGSEPSTVHHTYISLWCFFSLEGLTVISSTMSRGYLKSGNFLLLSILWFFFAHCHWDHFSQVPNDRICRLPSTVGKNCLPCTHTQRIARFLEDFYVCLRTTQHINLDSWTEKTWLASCAFKNTSRVNFFSQALYMTNAEIVFQPKTRMVNLSCKLSISLSLLPCDSKWLEMRLIYSSSIQTKHAVKL